MIRFLTPEEIQSLGKIVESHGWDPLSTDLGWVLGKLENGRIVGFIVCKLIPVVGPLWAEKPGHVAIELANAMKIQLANTAGVTEYLVMADHPFTQAYCEHSDMTPLDAPVFVQKDRVN